MIGVEPRQYILKRSDVFLLAGVGAAGPVLHKHDALAEHGCGLQLPGQSADPPDLFPVSTE